MKIPTPHIDAKDDSLIAKTVIMPGDPLRAKFIADTYLAEVTQFNFTRGMLGFTGKYHGKPVSVMGSGMGMPSIGIYSFELFAFYNVANIIRIGSCGAYDKNLSLYDVLIASDAWSESSYAKTQNGYANDVITPSLELNNKLIKSAEKLNKKIKTGRIHSSDVFYRRNFDDYKHIHDKFGCMAVEMEAFALFANAHELGKNAACILTVSDSLVTHEATSSEERQKSFTNMIEITLNSI